MQYLTDRRSRRLPSAGLAVLLALLGILLGGCGSHNGSTSGLRTFSLTPLVTDQSSTTTVDPTLKNAWGVAFGPTGNLWVNANGSGLSNVYTAAGAVVPAPGGGGGPFDVVIPPVAGGTTAAPTGITFNSTAAFMGDRFIFASEDGGISGWSSGLQAALRVDRSGVGAVYKGLTWASATAGPWLYAADFHNGRIDVFDTNYQPVTAGGMFVPANLPAGFAPFNIQNLNNTLYVTYARQDADAHDDVPGAGNGYVYAFDVNGAMLRQVAAGGTLNSPWGLALAPSDFGAFSNALLVGNFGDGRISAYNPSGGALLGQLLDLNSVPLVIPGLWGLTFGNDQGGASHSALYVAAGPNQEANGMVARLNVTF